MLRELLNRIRGEDDAAEDAQRVVALAAATLLIEVAWADHDIAEEELAVVKLALAEQFELTGEEVDGIVLESRAQHDESVGLYGFTRTLVEAWDEPARFDLIVQLAAGLFGRPAGSVRGTHHPQDRGTAVCQSRALH